jgi:hypothetical protein
MSNVRIVSPTMKVGVVWNYQLFLRSQIINVAREFGCLKGKPLITVVVV